MSSITGNVICVHSYTQAASIIDLSIRILTADMNFSALMNYSLNLFLSDIKCQDVHLFSYLGEIKLRHLEELYFYQYLHMVAVGLLILGILGNVTTIVSIYVKPDLHTPTFTMIACLAIEDLTGLIIMYIWQWTELITWIFYCVDTESTRIYGLALMSFLIFLVVNNSALHITLLPCIRYYIIVYPIESKQTLTCKLVILMSLICWIISAILGIIQTLLWTLDVKYNMIATLANAILVLIVPTVIMIVLHCLKIRAIKRSQTVNPNTSRKMSCVLSLILTIYILTAISYPYIVFQTNLSDNFMLPVNPLSLLYLVNFSVNPIIYFISTLPVKILWSKYCAA